MTEINILLILLFIHFIGLFVFKGKTNILSCGIFGQATKTIANISVPEVNILGIFNVERGSDCCGITYDGEIFLGLDKDKVYTNFIKKRNIKPKQYPVIFGHTRKSSVGSINSYNAHPFGFGTLPNGEFEFIGCHNGTLKNHEELAKKYEIDLYEDYINDFGYAASRKKIDSEILLEILWKTKSYKVLSEYIGGAALAWTWIGEPNKVYLWSGASKLYESSKDLTEERPLCTYQRSKNCTFFSSIEESLYALGGNENNTQQIDSNTVYCITDGDFKNAEKLLVSRRNSTQNEVHTSSRSTNFYNYNNAYENYEDDFEVDYPRGHYPPNFQSVTTPTTSTETFNIHHEPQFLPVDQRYGKIYFQRLRYQRNGHVITGIYTYIPKFGFYELGKTLKDANDTVARNVGVKFVNGMFDKFCKEKDQGITPFKIGNKPTYFYFIQGVMVKTLLDYLKLLKDAEELMPGMKLNTINLSHCSKHPITTISGNAKDYHYPYAQGIYFMGKSFTGTVCPLGSERIYEIKDGNLKNYRIRKDIDLSVIKKPETKVIELPQNLKRSNEQKFNQEILLDSQNKLIKLEELYKQEDFTEQILEQIKTEEDQSDIICQLIDEEFTAPIMSLNRTKKTLEDYLPNSKAKEATEIIEKINDLLTTFVMEPKK